MNVQRPFRRAFTIIELLVVIAIISILITLGLVVAGQVSGSGKKRVTLDTLKILDSALATFESRHGGLPPPTVAHPWDRNSNVLIPVADALNIDFTDPGIPGAEQYPVNNSVGLFMLQCQSIPEAAAALSDLDPKIVREYDALTQQGRANAQAPTQTFAFNGGSPPAPLTVAPPLKTAMDGWGNPIRYVHPAFKGNLTENGNEIRVDKILRGTPPGKVYAFEELRRRGADSDGGMPQGSRPYFYSCGPDGDPSTTEDNIYLESPKFVK